MDTLYYIEQRFNPFVAKKYGISEAVFIHKIIELQLYNAASGLNCRAGRYWVKSSRNGITKVFIFWTERQVQHLTEKLKEKGLLHIENFNQEKTDRTLWYSLTDEAMQMYNLYGGQFENFAKYGLNMNPPSLQKCKMDLTNMLNGQNQVISEKKEFETIDIQDLTNLSNGDEKSKPEQADIQDLTEMLNVYNNKENINKSSLNKEKEKRKEKHTKEKKEPGAKSRTSRTPEQTDLHNKAKQVFCEFYLKKTGEQYYWTAADAASLEQLLKKQKSRLESKNVSADNQSIVSAISKFFDAVPEWYVDKLSIKLLNSSYNSIIAEINKIKKPQKIEDLGKITGDKLGINLSNIEH